MSEQRENNYKTRWTVAELAKAAGVSKTWIYMQIRDGKIAAEKPVRDLFITDSEARRWLTEWKASREE